MKLISRDAVNNVLRVLSEYERGIVDGPERDPGLTLLQQQRHMIRATAFEEVMQALLLIPDVSVGEHLAQFDLEERQEEEK